jgi:hypothetical protein
MCWRFIFDFGRFDASLYYQKAADEEKELPWLPPAAMGLSTY